MSRVLPLWLLLPPPLEPCSSGFATAAGADRAQIKLVHAQVAPLSGNRKKEPKGKSKKEVFKDQPDSRGVRASLGVLRAAEHDTPSTAW